MQNLRLFVAKKTVGTEISRNQRAGLMTDSEVAWSLMFQVEGQVTRLSTEHIIIIVISFCQTDRVYYLVLHLLDA